MTESVAMNIEDFSEDEWQSVFDEFRLLVVRAGYADWDASAMDSLNDEADELTSARDDRPDVITAVDQLRRYSAAFSRFLKARSRYASEERLGQLGKLLETESGMPVEGFLVDFGRRDRAIFKGDDNPDAMIAILGRFLAELNGEDGTFWKEDPDDGEVGT